MGSWVIFLWTILLLMVLASCTQLTAPCIDSPHGIFQGTLIMYDSTGGNPIYGRLLINRGDSIDLSGSWSLQNNYGKLAGFIKDLTINVNLNPGLVDANTYLIGTFGGTTIKGQWLFVEVMGPINHGRFIATSD
jgi:hypothetical protein